MVALAKEKWAELKAKKDQLMSMLKGGGFPSLDDLKNKIQEIANGKMAGLFNKVKEKLRGKIGALKTKAKAIVDKKLEEFQIEASSDFFSNAFGDIKDGIEEHVSDFVEKHASGIKENARQY